MSAAALGVAGLLFQIRLMFLAGTDYEDLHEDIFSEIEQDVKNAPALLTVFALHLMAIFQFACWFLSSIISPHWDQATNLIPVAAWLGFLLGFRSLQYQRHHPHAFRSIDRGYLAVMVAANFALAAAITYFYFLIG